MVEMAKDDEVRIERLTLGPYSTNAYIIVCRRTQASLVVDAPDDAEAIIERLKGTTPGYILLTHNHGDHLGALVELHSKLKTPPAAHALDVRNLPVAPEILLSDGEAISLGNLKVKVWHTPGHTPGSLCFGIGRYLISGDTIFPGGPGKTRSPQDLRQLTQSLREKIFVLPDDTQIYPGHGEATTLKKEKNEFAIFASRPHNPVLCGDVLWLSS